MSEFINTIDLLGDKVVLKSVIEKTITEFKDNVITSIAYGSFQACSSLTIVDLPNVTYVDNMTFYMCSSLTALILRSSTMCALVKSGNSFGESPIASGSGYIYVPRALLSDDNSTSDYRRATNWTTLANQFRALEDYTVDGTTTGELDPSKI